MAIVLFGNRLPDVARSLGRSVNEFKRGLKEVSDDFNEAASGKDDPPQKLEAPRNPNEPKQVSQASESVEHTEAKEEEKPHS